jgi:hypothetical protein
MKIVFDTQEQINKAWNIAEKVSINGGITIKFKGAMFYSTLNICDAMQVLIQKRNYVAANILLRSLLEYLFRSYWLNRVATENEIVLAINEDWWPKTKILHSLIAEKNSIIDLLASEKLKIQDILHSYVHGGSQNPLSQLGSSGFIEPNITDSEVTYLLNVVQLCTCVTLSEMAHLSDSDETEAEIVRMVKELIGERII